ncbi:hypothetical protein [Aureimonas sp. AU4]|uniref:hypothetical protein n=1 Tax=Aureimonas sp. AU4 TaxID=1638163 RepID=UPI000786547D|nr:hypothetical protein [Aureimonas sp. AU4]
MSTESLKYAKFDDSNGRSHASPDAVVDHPDLDHDEKHSILKEWRARVDADNRADGIDPNASTLDQAIERLAGLRT